MAAPFAQCQNQGSQRTTDYNQRAQAAQDLFSEMARYANVSSETTCPLAGPETPESRLVTRIMFWGGITMMVAICIGIAIFIYVIAPKPTIIKSCPANEFINAKRIIVPSRARDIVIDRSQQEFADIISNFIDEKIIPDDSVYTTPLHIIIKNTRYVIEVSTLGWNFAGEEKNSRRLRNGMELMVRLKSVIERLHNSR